ncbi:hypothetical protein EYS09_17450 [Streptomyces kasugaensis]|uniref:Uncharacterized protein n=1 Tax=Streptomyces kasugaensis TaxID=1946 RepID=A0A4Q9HW15_STRKA|nr:hypothetical protein [Streptomyces kasugaensis]TBO58440.1 hypothetical protein EYS09_17450 [Streptomyces kasugaensis]
MAGCQDGSESYRVHLARTGDAGSCSGRPTGPALPGSRAPADELDGTGDWHRTSSARHGKARGPFGELRQVVAALVTEHPGGPAGEESGERTENAITLYS